MGRPEMLDTFTLSKYKKSMQNDQKDDHKEQFSSTYPNLAVWRTSMGVEYPTSIVRVCFGGNFAATTSNILDIDTSVLDNIVESLFAERLWGTLLADGLTANVSKQVLQMAD